jgi:hypothetical protein
MLAYRARTSGKSTVPAKVHRFTAGEDLVDRLFLAGEKARRREGTFLPTRSEASELNDERERGQ